MSDFHGIVYKITNIITFKSYVGETIKSLEKRWKDHVNASKKPKALIHKAIHKYGSENFILEIIGSYNNREILNIMETFYIMVHKTHVSENGYNLTWGGDGVNGYKFSDEAKEKMSEKRRNRIFTIEHKKHLSESQKGEKNHRWGKGYLITGEKSPMYGKHHTDEAKKKMSDKLKGDKHFKYKYYWEVKNIITGNVEIVKNKMEWCKNNNLKLDNVKYYAKINKVYKGFLIVRYIDTMV